MPCAKTGDRPDIVVVAWRDIASVAYEQTLRRTLTPLTPDLVSRPYQRVYVYVYIRQSVVGLELRYIVVDVAKMVWYPIANERPLGRVAIIV